MRLLSNAWLVAGVFICAAANAQTVVLDPVARGAQQIESDRKAESQSRGVGRQTTSSVKGSEGTATETDGQRYALPAKAVAARNSLLDKCLRVYSDNTTVHSHFFGASWKSRSWHILGTEKCNEGSSIARDVKGEDGRVIYTPADVEAFAAEARHLGTAPHLSWDVTNPDATALTEDEVKDIQKTAEDFALLWVASRPFDYVFPVHDDYTSRMFFGDARLSFLHSVQASGWLDRIAFNTELVSDRIGWGRLALIAAFAGTKPGQAEVTDEKTQKDNLQKFLTQGGDLGVTFELPLLYAETPLLPGFVLVEAYPRLVTAIPGMSSTVNDVSGAFEPGGRVHLRIRGWENVLSVYGEVWGGWIMGIGSDWQKYLNIHNNFGAAVANTGITISNKYNIGASYIVGGPLSGQNGVSISVSILTGK